MSKPQREWHAGDHGPRAWADRSPHPQAHSAQLHLDSYGKTPEQHACVVKTVLQKNGLLSQSVELPPIKLKPRVPQSQGRDPNDTYTMELPLDEPLLPVPNHPWAHCAEALYDAADDEIVWLWMLLGVWDINL